MALSTQECCVEMAMFLGNPNDPIGYNPVFREFYIEDTKTQSVITMEYCAWCGAKLPLPLRDNYYDILEKEYGLVLTLSGIKDNSKVPVEFKSDEWWKKRKL